MVDIAASFCPGVTRGYSSGRFGQIHYRRTGPAGAIHPLMLLHASPMSGYMYEHLMLELGADRSVVAPDTPGFGMSDPPTIAPEIADYAGAMFDLADDLGFETFDVMGYHTGAVTAVEMARQQPGRILRIVMGSAPIAWREEIAAKHMVHAARSPDDYAEDLLRVWNLLSDTFWPMQPKNRRWNLFLDRCRNLDVQWWGHRAVYNYYLPDALARVENPILVLNPQDDLWEITPRAAAFLRNGRIHDLPGRTFGFLSAEAAPIAELLRTFLDGENG